MRNGKGMRRIGIIFTCMMTWRRIGIIFTCMMTWRKRGLGPYEMLQKAFGST